MSWYGIVQMAALMLQSPFLAPGEATVLVSAAEASLAPVAQIDGFRLASIIDASTGMILAAVGDEEDLSLATVAAGAADMAQVLSMVSGELGSDDGLEDVMVTFGTHFHVIRLIQADAREQV